MLQRLPTLAVLVGFCLGLALSYTPDSDAARNSAGTYSLPSGNPVVSGNTITTSWANNTMSDLASELTNSLDRGGRGAMTAPLQCTNGSALAPSVTFESDTNTGIYRCGADNLCIAVGGVKKVDIQSGAVAVAADAGVDGAATLTGPVTALGGVTVTNSAAGNAITATGNSGGDGLVATGGDTGGDGVTGTGGAAGGYGGYFTGTAGTPGVFSTSSTGNANGIYSQGSGTGSGIEAHGGTTGYGGRFYPGASTTIAIRSEGNVQMTGSTPTSTTGLSNVFTNISFAKASARVTAGSATPTVNAGHNITGASCASEVVTVTLASGMAHASNWVPHVSSGDNSATDPIIFTARPGSATTVEVSGYRQNDADVALERLNLCTGAIAPFHLLVFGEQ